MCGEMMTRGFAEVQQTPLCASSCRNDLDPGGKFALLDRTDKVPEATGAAGIQHKFGTILMEPATDGEDTLVMQSERAVCMVVL